MEKPCSGKIDWFVALPKIELHAHLNGSVRDSTLLELAGELGRQGSIVFSDVEHVILKSDRSLTEVFRMFDLIHRLTTDHKTVTRITKEVVEDFAADNVVYLELRTTPKRNDAKGMTKRSYMEAVLEGIRSIDTVDVQISDLETPAPAHSVCNEIERKKIQVRLLLSIDRRETTEAAMETVELALEMRNSGVAGIDLSGNPGIGNWVTFFPALEYAKKQGLPVTLHCGELPNPKEIQAMLDFHPRRIGHACCFAEDEWEALKRLRIPVEICLTSNIRTATIASIDVHHFDDLYRSNHPIVLCTDDAGVFSTSLSAEYAFAASAFGLGNKEMFQLAQSAIDLIFASDGVKRELEDIFSAATRNLNFN